ncbi:hypothetical protein BJ741DRAFT_616583 [Chytriomyces cf. hyalinus JEL632]|nr:hypothetical protein BJ741DRAFT_616583 [Chytriomyces cf. hyalinus JEL632]
MTLASDLSPLMDAVAKMQLQLDAIQAAVNRKHCGCLCSCGGPETLQDNTDIPVADSSPEHPQDPEAMQLQPMQTATNSDNPIIPPSTSKPASVTGQSRPTSARSSSVTSSHATSNRIVLPQAMPPPPSTSPTATDIASAMMDGAANVTPALSLPQIQSISHSEGPSDEQAERPESAPITLQPGPRNKSMNRTSSLQVGPIPHGHPLYAYSLAAENGGDQPFLSKSLGRPVPRVMAVTPREPSNSSAESLESFEEDSVDLPRTTTPMIPQQQQQQQQQRNRLPRSSSDTKVIHANDHRNSRTFRLAGQEENWQTWESVLVESHGGATTAGSQQGGSTDFFPSPKRSSSVGRIGAPSGRGGFMPPPTPTGDAGLKPRFAAPLPPSNAYAPGRAR